MLFSCLQLTRLKFCHEYAATTTKNTMTRTTLLKRFKWIREYDCAESYNNNKELLKILVSGEVMTIADQGSAQVSRSTHDRKCDR